MNSEDVLDLHIEAARQQFDTTSIEQETRRFRERLARGGRRTRFMHWPAFASATAVALVALLSLSLFLPGNGGTAFAQAQQWLSSFHTLRAETVVTAGDVVSTVVAWLDESGDTRIESSGTTTIIKPNEGLIYGLLPDGQTLAWPITSEHVVGNAMEFVDNIRAFRGQAVLLSGTQLIDGIQADGYEVEVDGLTNVLWVDPADGRPLLVETDMPGGQSMRTVLRFDVALPDNAFEIPDDVLPAPDGRRVVPERPDL